MIAAKKTGGTAPRFLLALFLALPFLAAPAFADELERVVLLSRHNVRAPNASPADLARYTGEDWPDFSAPRGQLTANGRLLEALLGSYYHGLYADLLPAGKCGALYIHANVLERTVETGRALAETLEPGCAVTVHTVGEGKVDFGFDMDSQPNTFAVSPNKERWTLVASGSIVPRTPTESKREANEGTS